MITQMGTTNLVSHILDKQSNKSLLYCGGHVRDVLTFWFSILFLTFPSKCVSQES